MLIPRTRLAVRLLGLGILLLGAFTTAWAFTPASQNELYEIPLPQFGHLSHESYARDMGTLSATKAVGQRYGGNWHAYSWNAQTATPRFVYGTGADLGQTPLSAFALESMARQVIVDNPAVFRADVENLRLSATPHALGKWVAHFQQTYHGIDVIGGRALVSFSDEGRLLLMSSDYHSGIAVDPQPALPAAAAADIARSALPFDPETDHMEGEAELLVLPVPLSVTEVEHHLVWRVTVRTADPLGKWVTHVDAHGGEILWRYNDIHFAYGGDTESDAHDYGYCDGAPAPQTMPYLSIDVDGIGGAVSDANGDWDLPGTGGPRTVSCDLQGPYCHVYENEAGPEAFFSGIANEDVPFTVDFNDGNAQRDERDVFDAVNDVHDFISLFDPSFGYINQTMEARVSINDACNAFWDGTINFFRESGGCANTGELQQVVHHEFGHGVQWYIIGGQGNEGLGEGNSDILGNLITQDSVIGRGFYLNNCSSGIRNASNNLQYPEDLVGQVHHDGQIIAGFNWDAMLLLQDLYGMEQGTLMSAERWHFGRILLQPVYQPDQVFATFFADDDDSNLDNGTPHHSIFCEAAENHGYECPNAFLIITPDADTVWIHEEAPGPVTWAGAEGTSVVVDLYRGETQLTRLIDWTDNDGNETPGGIVDPAWGSGSDFRVRIEDDLGRSGYSAYFGVYGSSVWSDASHDPVDDASFGHGVAWTDFDGNGTLDLYLSNGLGVNRLFANDGTGLFTDASSPPVDDGGWGRGAAWGDYDNDGDPDLYLARTEGQANLLLRNDGGGVFVDVTSGPLGDSSYSNDAAWADYDDDGLLDLYVVNNYAADKLLHNEGGDVFVDVTAAPLGDAGAGRSASWADFDLDGDMDLFLAHNSQVKLYRNEGGGAFSQAVLPPLGLTAHCNGAAWGDYDNDGDPDLYLARQEANTLLRNDGGSFTDVTVAPLAVTLYTRAVSWGDFDNDGRLDLYLSNEGDNSLLRNLDGAVFAEATSPLLADGGMSRGAAWGDMDADGDLDLYVANYLGPNRLFRNDDISGNHWLHLHLEGTTSNRDGVGARVHLVVDGQSQYRQVGGDAGAMAQNSLTVEFGLGTATVAETVEIRWPSGTVQVLTDLAAGHHLVQESGSTAAPDTPGAVTRLLGNHPNPFNPKTEIRFVLGQAGPVSLKVYDAQGRLVQVLADGPLEAGEHRVDWNGTDSEGRGLATGVYFTRLETELGVESKRMVLIK